MTFRVYIQDVNGNPPVAGTRLVVEQWFEGSKLPDDLLEIVYPDAYSAQGTFRDTADPSTDKPILFQVVVLPGAFVDQVKLVLTQVGGFDPTEPLPPGTSGSNQEINFYY